MRIELDGSVGNKGHVFLWRDGRLVAKFWFYGDGTVSYREWVRGDERFEKYGEVVLLNLRLPHTTEKAKKDEN